MRERHNADRVYTVFNTVFIQYSLKSQNIFLTCGTTAQDKDLQQEEHCFRAKEMLYFDSSTFVSIEFRMDSQMKARAVIIPTPHTLDAGRCGHLIIVLLPSIVFAVRDEQRTA